MSPEKSLPQALHHSLGRTEYPPQRNYKKLFTFFLQRQETSLWFRHHTSQALPGTRPTRLSPPIGSLYVPRLLTCFITRILTLSASHLVAAQDMPPFVVPAPPQPQHSLPGNSDTNFPTQIPTTQLREWFKTRIPCSDMSKTPRMLYLGTQYHPSITA